MLELISTQYNNIRLNKNSNYRVESIVQKLQFVDNRAIESRVETLDSIELQRYKEENRNTIFFSKFDKSLQSL